ncbi:COG1470 family protein [Natronorubrum halophilum]|uniref:COG1470 family protein n=1 Tax=Natronorubrum halophilum TaxID=1702106 RepID=UPI0010C22ADC|nr:hypothetical protein [Natronorubrum halophilum]
MPNWHRRTVLATGAALSTGLGLASSVTGESNDDGIKGERDLELSVTASESVPYKEIAEPGEDTADFYIEVTNHGDESVLVEGSFKIGRFDEPLLSASPVELVPGETDTAYFGIMSRDLSPGDHEWTVTANDETETGTLTVTDTEGEHDLELSVTASESVPYKEIAEPGEDTADFYIEVTNCGDASVSVEGRFKIGRIDEPLLSASPVELVPGETDTAYFGIMSRDLSPGDHEWTVTANDETETGTLTVTDDEEC